MRLIALIIVVGSLILLGRWHSSHHESNHSAVAAEAGFHLQQGGSSSSALRSTRTSVQVSNRFSDRTRLESAATDLPVNAKRVRQLSRARYELPKQAAKLVDALISIESDCEIETRIIENGNSDLVTLEVTADEPSQRTTAKFLLTVYPPEKIASYKRAVDSDDKAETIVFGRTSQESRVNQRVHLRSGSNERR